MQAGVRRSALKRRCRLRGKLRRETYNSRQRPVPRTCRRPPGRRHRQRRHYPVFGRWRFQSRSRPRRDYPQLVGAGAAAGLSALAPTPSVTALPSATVLRVWGTPCAEHTPTPDSEWCTGTDGEIYYDAPPTPVPCNDADAAAKVRASVVRIDTATSTGTGIIVQLGKRLGIPPGAVLLTVEHVIDGFQSAAVTLPSGSVVQAAVAASSIDEDLAVLKAEPSSLSTEPSPKQLKLIGATNQLCGLDQGSWPGDMLLAFRAT